MPRDLVEETRLAEEFDAASAQNYVNLLRHLEQFDPQECEALITWARDGIPPEEAVIDFLRKNRWLNPDGSGPSEHVYNALPLWDNYNDQIKQAQRTMLSNLESQQPRVYRALLGWAKTGDLPRDYEAQAYLESNGWALPDKNGFVRPIDVVFDVINERAQPQERQADNDELVLAAA